MAERTVTRRRRNDDDYSDDVVRRGPRDGNDSSYDEDEDRGSSRSETARPSEGLSTAIGRGREGLRKHRETHSAASNFPTRFTVKDDKKVVVKFLDDDFFITYYQHWLNDSPVKQKSFICLGDDCPLCQAGDKPTFYALINVIDFTDKRDPAVRVWYASSNPGECIEEKINDLEDQDKKLTDADQYFVVSKKKGKNNFFSYTVERVKARDLDEDYDIPPLDAAELREFDGQKYDENIVRITPRKELREIADELDD